MLKRFLSLLPLSLCILIFSTYAQNSKNPVVPNSKLGEFRHGTYPSLGNTTHPGVDLVAPCGSDIYAFADGQVIDVVSDPNDRNFNSLGYMVLLEHPASLVGETFYTLYLHMQHQPRFARGDNVKVGRDLLGKVGDTGVAYGCNTHFEIRYFPERFSAWGNIYGEGDKREDAYFRENWADPAVWFQRYPAGITQAEQSLRVFSSFDTDAEGWAAIGDAGGGVIYESQDGNPGGYIRVVDSGSGEVMYWTAPSKFLNDQSALYRGSLQFDYQQSDVDNQIATTDDVTLEGAGIRLVFDVPGNPGTSWTHIIVPIDEQAGWLIENTKKAPTQLQMQQVLANLTLLQIRAEYRSGFDVDGLDNVELSSETIVDRGLPVSTFDTNSEGWRATEDVLFFEYVRSNDSPGGFIRVADMSTGATMYWVAPPKFLGDQSKFYNGTFEFEQRQSTVSRQVTSTQDVILEGDILKLTFDVPNNPGSEWTKVSIPLNETAGWVKADGKAPTQIEMLQVLGNILKISMRAEYTTDAETDDLDNVSFVEPERTSTEENNITGTIFDLTLLNAGRLEKLPLEGADVKLYRNGALLHHVTTTTDGGFSFENLASDGASYWLEIRATGIVPETEQEIVAHMLREDLARGTHHEFVLPRTLAVQKYSLIHELEHLKIKSELLFGRVPPFPLPKSYNENETRALLATWLNGAGGNQESVNTSLARLLLAEQVLHAFYEDAAALSHETWEALYEIARVYLSYEHMSKMVDGKLEDYPSEDLVRIKRKSIHLLIKFFIEQPAEMLTAALPAPYGSYIVNGFEVINESLEGLCADGTFLDCMIHNQGKNAATTAADAIFLPLYVVRTQDHLNRAVEKASAFEYSGDHIDAFAASHTVINESHGETEVAINYSEAWQRVGNSTSILGDILRIAGMGNLTLKSLGVTIKFGSVVSLASAAIISAQRLYQIQEELPQGIAGAFNPQITTNQILLAYGNTQAPIDASEGNYPSKLLLDGVNDYTRLLREIASLAQRGMHNEAIAKTEELIAMDESMSSRMLLAQAPIYAAAEQAFSTKDDFETSYVQLGDAIAAATVERFLLYTQLLEYAVSPVAQVDSLVAHTERVTQALEHADETITEVAAQVADVAAPPIVVVKKHDVVERTDAPNRSVLISATLQNAGTVSADMVSVELLPDSSAMLVAQSQYFVRTMLPGEEHSFEWRLQIVDTTKTSGNYSIKLGSSNAKGLSAHGSYSIATSQTSTPVEIGNNLPNEFSLAQNYPNPFNPVTTIRYDLPTAAHVTLKVFDIWGREVITLVNGMKTAGRHETILDARGLPSGAYFYRMEAGSFTRTRRLVLLK